LKSGTKQANPQCEYKHTPRCPARPRDGIFYVSQKQIKVCVYTYTYMAPIHK